MYILNVLFFQIFIHKYSANIGTKAKREKHVCLVKFVTNYLWLLMLFFCIQSVTYIFYICKCCQMFAGPSWHRWEYLDSTLVLFRATGPLVLVLVRYCFNHNYFWSGFKQRFKVFRSLAESLGLFDQTDPNSE